MKFEVCIDSETNRRYDDTKNKSGPDEDFAKVVNGVADWVKLREFLPYGGENEGDEDGDEGRDFLRRG